MTATFPAFVGLQGVFDFGIEYEINNFTPKNTDALSVTAVPRSPESVSQVTGQVGVYPGHYADVRRIREAEQDEAGGGWSEAL